MLLDHLHSKNWAGEEGKAAYKKAKCEHLKRILMCWHQDAAIKYREVGPVWREDVGITVTLERKAF